VYDVEPPAAGPRKHLYARTRGTPHPAPTGIESTMAITTTLQTKFAVQRIFVIVLCLVMGAWGVYDYAVKIPSKTRAFERGQVCAQVFQALDARPASEASRNACRVAMAAVQAEFRELFDLGVAEEDARAALQDAVASITDRRDQVWMRRLVLYQLAIDEASRRGDDGAAASERFARIYEIVRQDANETATISPPGAFDRATQWAFILCLPFVPYYTWSTLRTKSRVYALDDDGTFRSPAGSWAGDEIADIDMSRWMSKSVAFVVHDDGRRVKLDDYIYKNTHLIVGALAAARYPDQWDEDARERKDDEPVDRADGPEVEDLSDPDDPGTAAAERTREGEAV